MMYKRENDNHRYPQPTTFTTSSTSPTALPTAPSDLPSRPLPLSESHQGSPEYAQKPGYPDNDMVAISGNAGSTGKGILIGILSAFGSAGVAIIILTLFFFFRYTQRGRIILDRIGRPGEYDDEQAFAREEAEALETMDDIQRSEYLRAKGTTRWLSTLYIVEVFGAN